MSGSVFYMAEFYLETMRQERRGVQDRLDCPLTITLSLFENEGIEVKCGWTMISRDWSGKVG